MMRSGLSSGAARTRLPRRRRGRRLLTVAARARFAQPREARDAMRQLSDALELNALLATFSPRDQRIVATLMIAVLEIFQVEGEAAAQAALDQIDEILRGRKRGRRRLSVDAS